MGPSLVLSAFTLNMNDWEREDASNEEEEYKRNARSTRSSTRWQTANTVATTTDFGGLPPASANHRLPFLSRGSDATPQQFGYDAGVSSRYASAHFPPPYGFGISPKQAVNEGVGDDEGGYEEEEEEDRKPAAQPNRNLPQRGPFDESQEDESPPFETHTNPDHFINPSLSFGDDEEVIRPSHGIYEIEGLGVVTDCAAVETFVAARVPSYAPPLVYSIGGTPFHDVHQAAAAAANEDFTPAAAAIKKRRNLDSCRRLADAEELATTAGTDRARAAVVTWYDRFNELIDYAEVYGDCNVPQKYPENTQLGIWVNKQRMEKKFMDEGKRSSMSSQRVECLESIGFVWAKRKGEASWMLKFTELQQYKQVHGNCDVATKYAPNPALGRWVSTQRSEYKILQRDGRSKHMTQSRVHMLNGLGFKWEMLLTNRTSPSNSNASSSTSED